MGDIMPLHSSLKLMPMSLNGDSLSPFALLLGIGNIVTYPGRVSFLCLEVGYCSPSLPSTSVLLPLPGNCWDYRGSVLP